MGIASRIARLERRFPKPTPAEHAESDFPHNGDYEAKDRWLAWNLPLIFQKWIEGRTDFAVSLDFIPSPDGPFAAAADFNAAWRAYCYANYQRDGEDTFDFWLPNSRPEYYEKKLAVLRICRRELAKFPKDSLERCVLRLLPTDDGEPGEWAPIEAPTVWGRGHYDRDNPGRSHFKRRVAYRRRFLQRLAAEGDEEAAEDLAKLDAEAAAEISAAGVAAARAV